MTTPPRTPQFITLAPVPPLRKRQQTLQDLHTLPLQPGTAEQVLAAIHHPNSSAESVARVVQQDPVLCLKLFASAQRSVGRTGAEIHRLPHLLSLLGLPQVEQQVRAAPTRSHATPGYSEALLQSQLACQIGAGLWSLRGLAPEESFFPCLLAGAPLWQLWQREPALMEQRRGLLAAAELPATDIDRLTLGTDLQTLLQPLLQHWTLPTLVQQLWHSDPRQLRQTLGAAHRQQLPRLLQRHPHWEHGLHSTLWLVLGSQLLARSCAEHDHSRQHQHLLAALANLLHQPPERLSACTRHALLSCTAPHQLLHPAARLLQHYDARLALPHYSLSPPAPVTQIAAAARPEPTLSAPPAPPVAAAALTTTTPVPSHPPVRDAGSRISHRSNRVLLAANKKRLLERGADFQNLNQLLSVFAETLAEGLGLPLSGLLLLYRERTQLRSLFSHSEAATNPLHNLQLPLGGRDSFLARLLQKPAGLVIGADNYQRLGHLLPVPLQPLCRERELALMGLFNGGSPLGMALVSAASLSPEDYTDFKLCCQAANEAIGHFARQRQRS
jgi:HD-like signal output (HDOD) protein